MTIGKKSDDDARQHHRAHFLWLGRDQAGQAGNALHRRRVGGYPNSVLVEGADGNFYGTTIGGVATGIGGAGLPPAAVGFGSIFKISFNGNLKTLYLFTDGNDGAYPSGLIQGSDGCFYGTTQAGGANNAGTVFKMTSNGVLATLYSFTGGDDGFQPSAALVQANDGNLYGTTTFGGTNDVLNDGDGTIFKITTNGILTTLFSFGSVNGTLPNTSLIQGSDGFLYGTTPSGGTTYTGSQASGFGTIFRISTNGTFATLVSLNSTNGNPTSALVQGNNGNFYGVTGTGAYGYGAVICMSFAPPPPAPVFQSVTQSGTEITFVWNSTPGRAYQIQSTTDLTSSNWSNLGNFIIATNSTASGFDFSQRFYRVVLLP